MGPKILPANEDIIKKVKSNYGLEVYDIKPVRSAIKLLTNEGEKGLVKAPQESELNFLTACHKHLSTNGFRNFARFYKNKKKYYSTQIGNTEYVLLQWITGREVELKNLEELTETARTYATFHLAAQGIKPPSKAKYENNLGKWPDNLENHYQLLLKFRTKLNYRKALTEFDQKFLQTVDPVLTWCEEAIRILKGSAYQKLVKANLKKPSFIHHSCYSQNLMYTPQREVFLIDWGRIMIDLSIHDVANLITRHLRHQNWDSKRAQVILDGYTSIKKISPEEFELLKLLISFPQKYFVTANKYYSREDAEEAHLLGKLVRLEKEEHLKAKFLKNFDSLKF